MTDYNKSVNFAVKDTLTSGDPNKIVSGAEIDTEFNNISSASSTKIDKVPASTTGNIAQFTATGAIEDSNESVSSIITKAAMPSGTVVMHAATTAPSGWLKCDGSNVSRSTYPDLFNSIGTTFGAGDGTSTFGLPDLRGEFVRGWDDGRGVDISRSFGSFQSDQIKEHRHDAFAIETGSVNDFLGGSGADFGIQRGAGEFPTLDFGGDETRPRNVALMYIIKT